MKSVLRWIPVLVLAVILLFFLDALVNYKEKSDPGEVRVPEAWDYYNGYGLTEGQGLSDEILFSNDEVICYADRLVQHFSYSKESPAYAARIVRGIRSGYEGLREIYLVPLPPRAMGEAAFSGDALRLGNFLNALKAETGELGKTVDLRETFEEHKEEYLFFRTEHTMTSLGGLYASQALREAMGKPYRSRAAYQTAMYNDFYGSLYQYWDEQMDRRPAIKEAMDDIPEDPIFHFTLNGRVSPEVLYRADGTEETRPCLLTSTPGLVSFVGNDFAYALIRGDGEKDADENRKDTEEEEGLLLFCDGNGSILAPYLSHYYDTVLVVNLLEEPMSTSKMEGLIREYHIRDLVWAQQAGTFGDRSYSRALNSLVEEQ